MIQGLGYFRIQRIMWAVFLFFTPLISFPQSVFFHTNSISELIYHYRFADASQQLDISKGKADAIVLKAYNFYWSALSGLNHEQNLEKTLTIADEQLKMLSPKSDEFVALTLLKSRVLITRKKYLSALFHLSDIEKYLESLPKTGKNEFQQLVTALYDFYGSAAREEGFIYRGFLASWPASDKKAGLECLIKLSNSENIFIRNEAHYFLGKIAIDFPKDFSGGEIHFRYLTENYPENGVFSELYLLWLRDKKDVVAHNNERGRFEREARKSEFIRPEQCQHYLSNNPLLSL